MTTGSDHGPIQAQYRAQLNDLAKSIDHRLNGKARPRKIGFALLMFEFGEPIAGTGRVNYIGNAERPDMLTALKELVARWEGRVPDTGSKPQ